MAYRCSKIAAVAALVGAAGLTACDPPTPPPADLVVDVAFDAPDADPSDGVCAAAGGGCTLRAALGVDVDLREQHVVEIADGVDPVLTLGPIVRTSGLVLRGGGATIDAGGAPSFLRLGEGDFDIEDVTITGVGAGGAALSNYSRGTTQLRRVSIIDNEGWAINNDDTARVEITDSVISRNAAGGIRTLAHGSLVNSTVADNRGPGVQFLGFPGSRSTVAFSTISGNAGSGLIVFDHELVMLGTSLVDNGGFVDLGPQATVIGSLLAGNAGVETDRLTMRASTVSGNSAGLRLGGDNTDASIEGSTLADNGAGHQVFGEGPLRVTGSILAGAGAVCGPPPSEGGIAVTSGGWNVVTDASCLLTATGDQVGVDPLLGPLTDLGGPTQVRAPGAGSPAIDAVPTGTPGLCDGVVRDQRFVLRPQGTACEAGAVELPDVG